MHFVELCAEGLWIIKHQLLLALTSICKNFCDWGFQNDLTHICMCIALNISSYSGGHHNLYWCKTLNIYLKCFSKCKSRDSFKICSSWGFQNTPYMFKLIEFWLRYLRSKTNDMILKISGKLIEKKHLIGLLKMIFIEIDVTKSNQNNLFF